MSMGQMPNAKCHMENGINMTFGIWPIDPLAYVFVFAVLSQLRAIDEVLERLSVEVEFTLRRNADEVIHHAIGSHYGNNPIGLTTSGRRLIRSFPEQTCLTTHAYA